MKSCRSRLACSVKDKKFKRYSLAVLLLALLLPGLAHGQQVQATIEADSVYVGERFRVRVAALHPGMQVVFPAPKTLLGDAEMVGAAARGGRSMENGQVDTLVLVAATFALDSAMVRVPVRFVQAEGDTLAVWSEPVKVIVRSLVTPEDKTIRDLQGLAPLPRSSFWWWPYALAGGLLIAALLALWLWKRRRPAKPPDPSPSPLTLYQQTLQRLDALAGMDVSQHEVTKAFFVELTDVLRTYLAAIFGIPALEQTSQELLQTVRFKVDPPLFADLRTVLQLADLVKFADQHPRPESSRTALERTRILIQQLESLRSPGVEAPHGDQKE